MSRVTGRTMLSVAVVCALAVAVVGGMKVMGSPSAARARALDDRRENDLRLLQSEVQRHHNQKGTLPLTLDELVGSVSRRDPDTAREYEYKVIGGARYELCATFQTTTRDETSNDWNIFTIHSEGRQCFEVRPIPVERR